MRTSDDKIHFEKMMHDLLMRDDEGQDGVCSTK